MFIVVLKIILSFPYLIFKKIKDTRNAGIRLYGIYGYYGLPGAGKTIAMCRELRRLRKQYGDDIYIMTNFFYDDEDFRFESWQDLLKSYDKPLVCAWDEIQNEHYSRSYKNFPVSLLTLLTQIRKNNGVQILYTSQRWHFVDKTFRTLSFNCFDCTTIAGCFTITKMYDPIDYDSLCSNSDYDKRRRIKPMKVESFFQTDDLRNCYDSYQMLESAKTKDYMDRQEAAAIYKLGD